MSTSLRFTELPTYKFMACISKSIPSASSIIV
jgi:hypothetical protein